MLTLPTIPGRLLYSYQVSLDDVTYTLGLRWNARSETWVLSLLTAAGEPITVGRAVVIGVPLLGRIPDPRLPPGVVMAVDLTDSGTRPGRDDLGDRVQLVYLSAAEVAEIAAGG